MELLLWILPYSEWSFLSLVGDTLFCFRNDPDFYMVCKCLVLHSECGKLKSTDPVNEREHG
jgi:hypothetical protein